MTAQPFPSLGVFNLMRRFILVLFLFRTTCAEEAKPARYDPLAVADGTRYSIAFEVKDGLRNRLIPLRVYLPDAAGPLPVILFSHGLGGSRDNNPYLGRHWAGRGYAVVFIQHIGSDESAWKDVAPGDRMAAMEKAASLGSFIDRVKDVAFVIGRLNSLGSADGSLLKGRLDLKRIGMSGHSFGAKTTQAMVGQTFRGKQMFLDNRIGAAVMMSPSLPEKGAPELAFGEISIPCLLMTGTDDEGRFSATTSAERRKVFPALGKAPAWQVVFDRAEHESFSQRENAEIGRYGERILALTTAFWDATLKDDGSARGWLDDGGAREILDDADVWEAKER